MGVDMGVSGDVWEACVKLPGLSAERRSGWPTKPHVPVWIRNRKRPETYLPVIRGHTKSEELSRNEIPYLRIVDELQKPLHLAIGQMPHVLGKGKRTLCMRPFEERVNEVGSVDDSRDLQACYGAVQRNTSSPGEKIWGIDGDHSEYQHALGAQRDEHVE